MWKYCYTDELYHHGVKGMKWGVRKDRKKSSSSVGATLKKSVKKKIDARKKEKARQKAEEEAKQKVKELKRKRAKDMTDAELKERIARLELEKNYLELKSKTHEKTISRGKRFTEKFIDSSIDKIAENATADVVAQAVKVLTTRGVNKLFNEEVVFTNNKRK